MRMLVTIVATVLALFIVASTVAQEAAPPSGTKMVTIEVVIAEFSMAASGDVERDLRKADDVAVALRELEQQGAVTSLSRITLTSLDGGRALVQMGQRVVVPTGRTFSRRGGTDGPVPFAVSTSEHEVGTLVSAQPQIREDGTIWVQLQISKSQLAPQSANSDDANDTSPVSIPTSGIDNLTAESSVAIRPGKFVVVGESQKTVGEQESQLVILATARIEHE